MENLGFCSLFSSAPPILLTFRFFLSTPQHSIFWLFYCQRVGFFFSLILLHHCPFLLLTKNWHLSSASARIRSLAIAVANFLHTLKGVQYGDQEWGIQCSGKNWQKRPSDKSLQKILWAQVLHLLISRKALKSLVPYLPHD